jgi:hypothetical protein
MTLFLLTITFSIINANRYNNESTLEYPEFSTLNVTDSLDIAILHTSVRDFFPASEVKSVIETVFADQQKRQTAFGRQFRALNWHEFYTVLKQAILFASLFFFSFFLLGFMAERLAVYAFFFKKKKRRYSYRQLALKVRDKKNKQAYLILISRLFLSALLGWTKTLLLFTPAFILAYMFKAEFDAFTLFSYLILVVFSNGTLIVLKERFLALFQSEAKRGYLETAKVKQLKIPFIKRITLYSFLRRFQRLVWQESAFLHLYLNAKKQIIESSKTFALFLMSVMIVVEMALNAQGFFGYELLRALFQGNSHLVCLQLLFIYIFLIATDLFTEKRFAHLEARGR